MNYKELKLNIARAGLTLKEFAELIGSHPNSITNLKQREAVPKNIAIISILMAELAKNEADIKTILKRKMDK
jgi:antitoxin component HigA of HigAB toxin-antitoxin module